MQTFKTFQVDSEREPELYKWLQALPNGARSHEIRKALKRGLSSEGPLEERLSRIEGMLLTIQARLNTPYDATNIEKPASEAGLGDDRGVVLSNLSQLGV